MSTIDFDNVTLKTTPATRPPKHTVTNLGQPIAFANNDAGTIFQVNGRAKFATLLAGAPTHLQVVDIVSNKLEADIALPLGPTRSFSMAVDSSSRVYISNNSNVLYRWTPGQTKVEAVGKIPGTATASFALALGPDGSIYGGTYDPNGARVFAFNPSNSTMRDLGIVASGQQYVNSLDVDRVNVYAGGGTAKASLYQIPIANPAAKSAIPLPETLGTGIVNEVEAFISGGKTFINVQLPTPAVRRWRTYDVSRKSWDVPWNSTLESHAAADGSELFILHPEQVNHFVPTSNAMVWAGRPGMAPGRDVAVLKDAKFNGEATGSTWVATYDPASSTVHVIKPDLTAAGSKTAVPKASYKITLKPITQKIKRFAVIPNGATPQLFLGGYGGSAIAVHDIVTSKNRVLSQDPLGSFGEPEGFGYQGNQVLFGSYPKALIYRFDPAKPWSPTVNPVQISSHFAVGQDRPMAWASSGSRAYFGTVPVYGQLGGGLGIISSQTATPVFIRNVVQDQSITTMAAAGNIVYGGTSRWGGLGTPPKATSAVAFAYDTVSKKKLWTFTPPVENGVAAQVVTMTRTPDNGRLFATVGDKMFELDPLTGDVVGTTNFALAGTQDSTRNQWLGSAVAYSKGWFFVRLPDGIWVVNPDSAQLTRTAIGTNMTQVLAAAGDKTYYSVDANLYRVTTTR